MLLVLLSGTDANSVAHVTGLDCCSWNTTCTSSCVSMPSTTIRHVSFASVHRGALEARMAGTDWAGTHWLLCPFCCCCVVAVCSAGKEGKCPYCVDGKKL